MVCYGFFIISCHRHHYCYIDRRKLAKGKPSEKVGRKATNLSPPDLIKTVDMAAGLPGNRSTFQDAVRCAEN